MRKLYSIIRATTLTVIITAITIYLLAFILLSIPGIQDKVRQFGIEELSKVLGTEVSIDHIEIKPFNKLALYDVHLPDQQGDTLLHAHKMSAGISLSELIFNQKLVFTNIQLFGADVRISQKDANSPTNMQFVIDALRSKEESKEKIQFRINNAIIRQGKVRYDLLSEPYRNDGSFDHNHIHIENLRSKLAIKAFTEDSVNISVKRLAFDEQSGFTLNRMQFKLEANPQQARLSEFEVSLPNSTIKIAPLTVALPDSLTREELYRHTPIDLQILSSTIIPNDLSAFIPSLHQLYTPLNFSARLSGTLDNLSIAPFTLNFGKGEITANSKIQLKDIANGTQGDIWFQTELSATAHGVNTLSQLLPLASSQRNILARLGNIGFNGSIHKAGKSLVADGNIATDLGNIRTDIDLGQDEQGTGNSYCGFIETQSFNLNGLFAPGNPYGKVALKVELDSRQIKGEAPTGTLIGIVNHFDYKGYPYENITLNGEFGDNRYQGFAQIDDPNGSLEINGFSELKEQNSEFDLSIKARDIRVAELQILPQYPNSLLGFNMAASFVGNNLDNAEGNISVDSLTFDYNNDQFVLEQLNIEARNHQSPQSITVTSDYLNGYIEGVYQFSTLTSTLQNLIAESLPALFPSNKKITPKSKENTQELNNFNFHFTIEPNIRMAKVFELPITFTDQVTIDGDVNSIENTCNIQSSIPYFWFKKFRIEDTHILAQKTAYDTRFSIGATSHNKKEIPTTWLLQGSAVHDTLDLNLDWSSKTESSLHGKLNTTTRFSRSTQDDQLVVKSQIKPSNLIFNDSTWTMKPSEVSFCDNRIEVKGFEVSHAAQYVRINGSASDREEDALTVQLNNMNLDYIFNTLNIRRIDFGGRATGEITATHLFTQAPRLNTKEFHVKEFAYNDAVFGDLNLFSMWDTDNQSIVLNGSVENAEKCTTLIKGAIFPTRDSLAFSFSPDRLNAAFLRPFLENILVDLSGVASGEVDFYGTFKKLNVTGDAYIENASFGIKPLNTFYTLSDSIHMSPTAIWFDNVTVYDKYRNTAVGSGRINHKHFKNVSFDINISNMQNILAFNVTGQQSPNYFGTIFAKSGTASIKGDEGYTTIDVSANAGEESKFTLDLSGSASANDYDFIAFTDSKREEREALIANSKSEAEINNEQMKESFIEEEIKGKSIFDMKLNVTVDKQTQIALVTDRRTGDQIKATGEGVVLVKYNTGDGNIDLQGGYTLEQGQYNFSLQDIITRDFTIEKGSRVEFHGDPMATTLDIKAHYPCSASLLDLDKDIANDLNSQQTTQPVHAILNISGDVRKPDLAFGLEFPHLNRSPEVVRRIESLFSTEEMKTQQVIYLLALNRFYTPEYMNTSGTRNNELASVASSTLSAQLRSLLGGLSENWNIAPNFRSEKGDFSDMEVELALSSQLLDNRLTFNGNFGYRNSTVDNNTFIGDFDLEYSLNKSGTFRLKAYNRYNDRNYTIKSALTTQGVGVIFRRDFNQWFDLFRRKKEEKIFIPHDHDEPNNDTDFSPERGMDSFSNDFLSNEAIE